MIIFSVTLTGCYETTIDGRSEKAMQDSLTVLMKGFTKKEKRMVRKNLSAHLFKNGTSMREMIKLGKNTDTRFKEILEEIDGMTLEDLEKSANKIRANMKRKKLFK